MVTPRFGTVVVDIYGGDTTPLVDIVSPQRSVEHNRIGKPPIKQDLGPGLRELRVRGECVEQTAQEIEALRGAGVSVRLDRITLPQAFIEETETAPLEKRFEGQRVFEYTIELTETQP
jgi:hypothetical protein